MLTGRPRASTVRSHKWRHCTSECRSSSLQTVGTNVPVVDNKREYKSLVLDIGKTSDNICHINFSANTT